MLVMRENPKGREVVKNVELGEELENGGEEGGKRARKVWKEGRKVKNA